MGAGGTFYAVGFLTLITTVSGGLVTPFASTTVSEAAYLPLSAYVCVVVGDDVVAAANLDGHCAVVALTHDPKLDDLALMEALKSPAFYVGAIGSRRTQAKRRERLIDEGMTEAELANVYGPAGLDIGADTPAASRQNPARA